MEEDLNINNRSRDKVIHFFKENKVKLFFLILIIITFIVSIFIFKIYQEKQNIKISEKYIKAGIYLSTNDEKKAKKLYEEIINSKNEFYSILSLNTILEKGLEKDINKILNYFTKVESSTKNKENKHLINLKKALYLIKESNITEGKKLLQDISDSNSKLKLLAKELLID